MTHRHPSNVDENASNKPASSATAFVLPGTATAPYRPFSAALSNGDTCPVHATNGTDWQDFIGTYNAGTLAQTTLIESSTGAWIDWSSGAVVNLEIAWLGATGENAEAHLSSTANPHSVTAGQVGAYTSGAVDTLLTGKSDTSHAHTGVYEPANANIQSHISSTSNPHSVTAGQVGAEPANANIQTHLADTALHSVGAQINAATSKATPVDADSIGLIDSEDGNTLKELTWANLKARLTSTFAAVGNWIEEVANVVSRRNGTNAQTIRNYTTYTDASNYERLAITGTAGSNVEIKAETAGTGADKLDILITPGGTTGNVGIGTTNPLQMLTIVRAKDGAAPIAVAIANSEPGSSTNENVTLNMIPGPISDHASGPGFKAIRFNVGDTAVSANRNYGLQFQVTNANSALTALTINNLAKIGIGTTSPTALLHIKAGTATASAAPLKFTSGTLLTTAEAGAIEFLTDDFFATITTGAARKAFVLDDGTRLTSGRLPFATTAGRLVDDADLTFATDTLTATKLVGTTSIKVGTAAGYLSSDGSAGATGSFTTTDLKTVTVKDGIITSIV